MAQITVTVTGEEDQLAAFAQLCLLMGNLGAVGASRTIQIEYDGDGNAGLQFDFGTTDVTGVETPDFDDDAQIIIGIGG